METTILPAILREENILIPLKIDITCNGARYVDTICWGLGYNFFTAEEFAIKTCEDLNLCNGFIFQIYLQVKEQIEAYKELIKIIKFLLKQDEAWGLKVREVQVIQLGVRHNTLDYSDTIHWDPMSIHTTPERFAKQTRKDLGLPNEMEPVIAHKIRESVFRWLVSLVDTQSNAVATTAEINNPTNLNNEFKPSEIKLNIFPANVTSDLAGSLWRKARPTNMDEVSTMSHPLVPADKDSNCHLWK